MKLVPLGDRVVLKTVRSRRNNKNLVSYFRDRHRKNRSRQKLLQ